MNPRPATRRPTAKASALVRAAQWRVTFFSLACVSVLMMVVGLYALREYETRAMELVARSLAFAGEPALRFNDRQSMRELVDQVATAAQLGEVTVSTKADPAWLHYVRGGDGLMEASGRRVEGWLMPEPTSAAVGDTDTALGSITLHSDGRNLLRYIEWTMAALALSVTVTAMAVLAYSRRLASAIVRPINALASLTRQVRESRSFERRAKRGSVKEINALADDFNALLSELQSQRAVIDAHHAELRHTNESLRTLSRHDSLTSLPNRAYLGEHLAQTIETCRLGGKQAGLLFIDTDRFKEINDRFGHAAGDALLVELSSRLRMCIRDSDFVARLGGDEFVIVIAPLHDSLEITQLTGRIRVALGQRVLLPGGVLQSISVTMGVSIFPDHAADAAELIRAADEAMYQAKSIARGSIATFEPTASGMASDFDRSMRGSL